MKNFSLKKCLSIPIAYLSLAGGLISILIVFFGISDVAVSDLLLSQKTGLLIGALVGGVVSLKTSLKRKEIGATFFGVLGMGITAIIISITSSSIGLSLATLLNGFYSVWVIGVSINWIVKQSKLRSDIFASLLSCILFSGLIVFALSSLGSITTSMFLVVGIVLILVSVLLLVKIPAQIIRFIVVVASRVLFRFNLSNVQNIPMQGGALLVSNHVSFLDFIILSGSIQRNIRFVMHQDIFDKKFLKPLLTKLNMIPISPRGGKNNLEAFNERCRNEINAGHLVVIFAEGTVTRNGQTLPFKKGVEYIAKGITAPIIPVNLEGVLGTPLSFTNNDKKAIKPSLLNLKQKIHVTVGETMLSTSSVYAIRQKILALGANTFANRVDKRATLGRWVLNLKGDNNLIQDEEGKWLTTSEVKKQSLLIASRLKNTLNGEKKVALLHNENINFNLFTYALSILGKEIVVLDPKKGFEENKEILKQLNVSICINGVGRLANPCKGYINAKNVMTKSGWKETVLASFNSLLPVSVVLSLFKNNQTKYSSAFTFAGSKDGRVKGNTVTNTNIFAISQSLQQIHLTSSYGTILSLHKIDSVLGLYMKVLIPVTIQTPVTMNTSGIANTIVGKVADVEKVLLNDPIPVLKKVLLDNQDLSELMMEKMCDNEIAFFQGFGVENLSPIVAVNIPNYIGKDIVGKPLVQESNNPDTVGRPIPSVAIKIVAESSLELGINEWGKVLINGASLTKQFIVDHMGEIKNGYNQWVDTNFIGMVDENGYLTIQA